MRYKIVHITDNKDDFFSVKIALKNILNDTELIWINSFSDLMEFKVQTENTLLILLGHQFEGISAKNLIQYFSGYFKISNIVLLTSSEENITNDLMKMHETMPVFHKNKLNELIQFVLDKKIANKTTPVFNLNSGFGGSTFNKINEIDFYQKQIPDNILIKLSTNSDPQLLLNQNFEILGYNQKASHLFESNLRKGGNFLKIIDPNYALLMEDKIQKFNKNSISLPAKINNLLYKSYIQQIENNEFETVYAISFLKCSFDKQINSFQIDQIKNTQMLIENSKSIVFQLNNKGEVIYLSDSYKNITGYDKEEVLNKPLGTKQNNLIQEKVKNIFDKFYTGELTEATDYTITKTKDNKTVYFNYRVEAILDKFNNFNGAYGVFTDVTEVIQVSETLKKTEDSLELIINNIHEVIFVLDDETRINFVTPNCNEITGYSTNELLNERLIDFVHPSDYFYVSKFMKQKHPRNTINGTGDTMTPRFKKKNGIYINLEINIKKLQSEDGELTKYIGSCRNVDKKIADSLKLSDKKKYLEIINEIQSFYIETKDKDKTFEFLLKRILFQTNIDLGFIFEVLTDENNNLKMQSKIHCTTAWNQLSSVIFEKNIFKEIEFKNINVLLERVLVEKKLILHNHSLNDSLAGEIIPGLPSIQAFIGIPVFNNNNIISIIGLACIQEENFIGLEEKIQPILAIIVSIIEQNNNELAIKKSLKELAKSENKSKAILTSIEDIIIEINHEFIVLNIWTKNFEKMFIPTEQMIDKNLSLFIDRFPFIQNIYDNLLLLSQDGISRIIEYPINDKNEMLWKRANIYLLAEKPEKLYCLQISDITVAKNAEENLKENLLQEKELAESKSKFVTLTSHEFRTPLTSISSSNELIYMHLKNAEIPMNDKLTKYINNIQNQVKHMSDLVDDVIKIGKLDANKMVLDQDSLNLIETLENIIENLVFTHKIPRKIKVITKGKPYKTKMDIKVLNHIMENIINNAFKYSPQLPDPILEIIFKRNQITIALQDFGIGIPKQDQPQLFEYFFRASNVGEISGVGLGLIIVKKLVDTIHGNLSIESEEGKGTRVIITFNKQQ